MTWIYGKKLFTLLTKKFSMIKSWHILRWERKKLTTAHNAPGRAGATEAERTATHFPARLFGRVGSQRVTFRPFSNYPSPNRTCHFHGIRLSSGLRSKSPYGFFSCVLILKTIIESISHFSGLILRTLASLSHFAL